MIKMSKKAAKNESGNKSNQTAGASEQHQDAKSTGNATVNKNRR